MSRSIEERLRAFAPFESLSDETRRGLAASARAHRFDEETPLVRPGDDATAVPLVESGVIRVTRTGPDGRQLELYEVEPGEACVLSLGSVLRGARYPALAVAAPRTQSLLIDGATLRRAWETDAALRQYVLELLVTRLEDLMALVDDLAFQRLDARLARLLAREATRVAGALRPVEMSHADLAARLGSAREVISRLLDAMRREGWVRLERGRIHLLDLDGLAARYDL